MKQAFEGVKEIKIMNTENEFINSYDKQYKKKTELDVRYATFNTMPKYLIEVFAVVSVLGFLAFNLSTNSEYMKLLPQLATFAVAAFKLLPCVNATYSSVNVAVYYRASLELVYRDIKKADEMDVNDEILSEDIKDFPFNEVIRLEHVTFRYEGTEEDVLKDAVLEIKKGQSVALIGASGGGKTTTADIILSLLEPVKGQVTVDGKDIAENVRGWRKKIGYIPQFIYLTDESIRKNVAFGIEEDKIDDKQVWKVLEDAQLKEFVESLPQGLDTVVGERGARISGGQRQRVGIARALYRDPEVLVFDEATSALDTDTEKEVMKAVDKLTGTKTILMIAHRLSTIENCDVVYRVEKGSITRER
jgi:ABC-type multidrug transport system fused ATPase/permease subunit